MSVWAGNIVNNCMNVQPGERVCVIVDEALGFVRDALVAEVSKLDVRECWTYTIYDQMRPIVEYPPEAHAMVRRCEVNMWFWRRYEKKVESPALISLLASFKQGPGRVGFGGWIDERILENEMSADYFEVDRISKHLGKMIEGGDRVVVTTPAGTNLAFSIKGRPIKYDNGLLHAPCAYGNLPGGETYVAPLEETVEGVLVVDLNAALGEIKLLAEPITVRFSGGKALSIEGGKDAEELTAMIAAAEAKPHGQWARFTGEFAMGTNPRAQLTGNFISDEKVMGTAHFALGNNTDMPIGGVNRAPMHTDLLIGRPTIMVDGKTIMVDGKVAG